MGYSTMILVLMKISFPKKKIYVDFGERKLVETAQMLKNTFWEAQENEVTKDGFQKFKVLVLNYSLSLE